MWVVQVLASRELPPEVSGEERAAGQQGMSGPHQVLRLETASVDCHQRKTAQQEDKINRTLMLNIKFHVINIGVITCKYVPFGDIMKTYLVER